jgi:hypothetical protein
MAEMNSRKRDLAAYDKWHNLLHDAFGSYTISSQMDENGSRFVMLEVIKSEEVLGRGKTWAEAYEDASLRLPQPISHGPKPAPSPVESAPEMSDEVK